jgi:hypothetical protein
MTYHLQSEFKRFHFQEPDWIISFPKQGNECKKYLQYTVELTDLKKNETAQMTLLEIVDRVEFENKLPYTVGFFKDAIDNKNHFKAAYLEIRVVRSLEDFWKFLNDLNI